MTLQVAQEAGNILINRIQFLKKHYPLWG